MEMVRIARMHSDFPTKFGIPRQSGLVMELTSTIVFEPAFRNPDAVRGLEGYEYIWVLWEFSASVQPKGDRDGRERGKGDQDGRKQGKGDPDGRERGKGDRDGRERGIGQTGELSPSSGTAGEGGEQKHETSPIERTWSPTVRPPRLGGNTRVGVFATRSPFRPNPIGLSSVRLEAIEEVPDLGWVLRVSGADLMDGTPIYDIKPYVPHVDSHPDATGGFSSAFSDYALQVVFPEKWLSLVPDAKRAALLGVLRNDPRPAYQDDPERIYGLCFAGQEVKFRVRDKILTVCGVYPQEPDT